MSREGKAYIGVDNGEESVAGGRSGGGGTRVVAPCWLQERLLLVPLGSWLGRVGTCRGRLGVPGVFAL